MSDTSQGPGWWQASDGKWYPPQAAAPPPPAGGVPPGGPAYGQSGGPQAGQQRVSIGDAFNYGWTKFQQNVGPIILALLASMGIGLVISIVLSVVLRAAFEADDSGGLGLLGIVLYLVVVFLFFMLVQMAIIRGSLFIVQGRPLSVKEMFNTDQVGQYLVASLILTIAVGIGSLLFVIPGLVIGFFGQYFGYFLLDKRMNSLDAVKASMSFVNKNLGSLITFYIGCIVAYMVGALLCLIGLIVAIPVVVIAQAYMYRQLQGEPVAP